MLTTARRRSKAEKFMAPGLINNTSTTAPTSNGPQNVATPNARTNNCHNFICLSSDSVHKNSWDVDLLTVEKILNCFLFFKANLFCRLSTKQYYTGNVTNKTENLFVQAKMNLRQPPCPSHVVSCFSGCAQNCCAVFRSGNGFYVLWRASPSWVFLQNRPTDPSFPHVRICFSPINSLISPALLCSWLLYFVLFEFT